MNKKKYTVEVAFLSPNSYSMPVGPDRISRLGIKKPERIVELVLGS
jgi:hypothetical protein